MLEEVEVEVKLGVGKCSANSIGSVEYEKDFVQ